MQVQPPSVVNKQSLYIDYTLYPNGIHEFIIKVSGRATIDEIIAIFEEIYRSAPQDQVLLRLFDVKASVSPVSYAIQQTRGLIARTGRPPKSRNAILYRDGLAISLLQPSVRFLPFAMPLAFFRPHERDRAVTWLLQK
jgi:hypothetical protein